LSHVPYSGSLNNYVAGYYNAKSGWKVVQCRLDGTRLITAPVACFNETDATIDQIDYLVFGELLNASSVSDDNGSSRNSLFLYPNPATEVISVHLNQNSSQPYVLRITNLIGDTVLERSGVCVDGSNTIHVQIGSLAKSAYVISVETPFVIHTSLPFVVQ